MTEATVTLTAAAAAAPPRYTRANPFPARMVVNRRLSGPESAKDTRHFEIDLTGWGLTFEVGDSLAVYATNDPELVDEIIRTLGATGDEQVPRLKGEPTTFARSATARLQHHAANAEVFEGHCRASFRCAYVDVPSRSKPQTGPRDLPVGHGNSRFPLGPSLRPVCAGRVCRLTREITAAPLFGGLELESVPRPGALYRGRRPVPK